MLDLLKTIRQKFEMSMLLITHNIAVVANLCDTVNVMYAGKIMETGPKKDVILSSVHPYTVALISAVPGRKTKTNKIILQGDPPNLITPPKGCTFHPRCPVAIDTCGWTADEVAADLEYLAQGKYFDKLGDGTKIEIKNERTVAITGSDVTTITEVVNAEKQVSRSLSSVATIGIVDGVLELKLKDYEIPALYRQNDGRLVSCLLYQTNVIQPQAMQKQTNN